MKNCYLLLFLFLFGSTAAYSQLNYLASNGQVVQGTYTDLGTSGTIINTPNTDDALSLPVPIGFTFSFNGTNFTDFILSTNGWIKLGTTAPSTSALFFSGGATTTNGVFKSTSALDVNILAAFMHDLIGTTGAEYRVHTTGSAPNRITTIQFKNLTEKHTTPSIQFSSLEFQIKLYETTNIIEFVYGTFVSTSSPSAFRSAGVGIKGSGTATNQMITITKGSLTPWEFATFLQGDYTGNAFNYGNGVNPNSRPTHTPGITYRFSPIMNDDIAVQRVYTLGKQPIPMASSDTIKAYVNNVGINAQSNFKVYLQITGANPRLDSVTVSSLAPSTGTIVTFPAINLVNTGHDTIKVFVLPDQNVNNDQALYVRHVNNNTYSYTDLSLPAFGGVGFTGATGDFVAKFHSSLPGLINQVSVNFNAGGNPFQIGIWDATGPNNTPGANLWTSATATSVAGVYTMSVSPAIPVNGGFFVGVKQTGTTNIAFSYQPENPIRPQTFYFTSPSGGTTWNDFAPNSPFRFMIEPRLQIGNDVGVASINDPAINAQITTSAVPIAPKATITNYGFIHQNTPFDVTFQIKQGNTIIYTSTKQETLDSGMSKQVVFDSTFVATISGNYEVLVFTSLSTDLARDNDTLKTTYTIVHPNDVGALGIINPVPSSFIPKSNTPITPQLSIINHGSSNQNTPFNVTYTISHNGAIVYTNTQTETLNAFATKNVNFASTFIPSIPGVYDVKAYTDLPTDQNRANDTITGSFTINFSDVGVVSIDDPAPNSVLNMDSGPYQPKATITNFGNISQNSPFNITYNVMVNGNLIYSNTQTDTIGVGVTKQITFDNTFIPSMNGIAEVTVFTSLPNDDDRSNDTLKTTYTIVKQDVAVMGIAEPDPNINHQRNSGLIAPKAVIQNLGDVAQTTPFNVTLNISLGGNMVYTSTQSITLNVNEVKIVTFDSTFIATLNGIYAIQVYTSLASDQNRSNDTLNDVFQVITNNDVSATNIILPANNANVIFSNSPIGPRASFTNIGVSHQTNPFNVTFTISRNGTLVYTSTKQTTINRNVTQTVNFDTTFIPNAEGLYVMKVYSSLATDQDRTNDTITGTFMVIRTTDVGVEAITAPTPNSNIELGSAIIAPKASIRNYGDSAINNSFNVTYNVSSGSNIIYTSTRQIPSMGIGSTQIITFDSTFAPTTLGQLQIKVFTSLSTDQDRNNDTVTATVNVVKSNDIAVISIDDPVVQIIDLNRNFTPLASIQNLGTQNQTTPFGVTFNILEGNSVVYTSTKTTTLNAGNTQQVVFDNFVANAPGNYTAEVFSSLATDQNRTNDTIRYNFSVERTHDVGISAINFPQTGTQVDYNTTTPVTPSATVQNFGTNDQTAIEVVFEITSGTSVVYTSTKPITINSGATQQINFDPYLPNQRGDFGMRAFTKLAADVDHSNDTLSGSFNVEFSTSILTPERKISFSVKPNPFNNNITIAMNENVNNVGSIEIVNLQGKTVRTINNELLTDKIVITDMEHLSPGVYILNIQVNGVTYQHKIVKL